MSGAWKGAVLDSPGELPEGYRRKGRIVGRAEHLERSGRQLWSESEFKARTHTPHTTSSVEARIRRRQLQRLVEKHEIGRAVPVLDLGCADGTIAHDLLDLGFEKIVSTDLLPTGVAALDRSLGDDEHDRVLLIVDDMLTMPVRPERFGMVIAWGILSVSGDFDRALGLAWDWVAPGGYLLHAEPLREQALVYSLVRGDLEEFSRVHAEGTRAGDWEDREDRYVVNTHGFYQKRLEALPGATIADSGGINMLPSLILGGLVQDSEIEEGELQALSELLSDAALDSLALWRQAYWLLRK